MARCVVFICATSVPFASPAYAQAPEEARALAVADSALAAITRGDTEALTDLMLEEALMFPAQRAKASSAIAFGRAPSTVRRMAGIVERGYKPEVRVQGPIAMVWYPYDLNIEGNGRPVASTCSHCSSMKVAGASRLWCGAPSSRPCARRTRLVHRARGCPQRRHV
jgi:hypothetical protein